MHHFLMFETKHLVKMISTGNYPNCPKIDQLQRIITIKSKSNQVISTVHAANNSFSILKRFRFSYPVRVYARQLYDHVPNI